MALTGTDQSPGPTADTPAPDTATLAAIRAWIKPETGWWQFELRPWHYAVSFACTAVVTAAFVALLATHGAVR